jgi:hypothetical protein
VAAVRRRLTKYPKNGAILRGDLSSIASADFPSADFSDYNVWTIVRGSHE